MRRPDVLSWDVRLDEWLFTVALGLAVGLCLVGLWEFRQRRFRAAAVFEVAGLAVGATVGLGVLDASPVEWVHFQLKPFASTAVEGGALAGGLVLGAALVCVVAMGLARSRSKLPLAGVGVPIVFAGVAALGLLWGINAYNTRNDERRHPIGMLRPPEVAATKLIEGLVLPTGIAVAQNGDLAVVELEGNLHLYKPAGDAFEEKFTAPLPVAEDAQGFHVIFHPDYPATPILYVTGDNDTPNGPVLQVIRFDVSTADGAPETLIPDLPVGRRDIEGVHYGSALAICGDSFFVSTADTEPSPLHHLSIRDPRSYRAGVQSLDTGIGKILRWKLDGIDLVADGLAGTKFPIYAFGFRNPFGMTCDTETGFPFVADNGAGFGHDQLRLVTPGMNAEWPLSDERNALADPLYDTGVTRTAPTGVIVRTTETGREAVWSAFNAQAVYAIGFDSSGKATGKLRLLREVEGGAFAIASDSRGCVYFSDPLSIWRLDDGRCDR
ncbi:MAG: sorbosone dehydrogenase family protein [Dehalococcoidia bacterium]